MQARAQAIDQPKSFKSILKKAKLDHFFYRCDRKKIDPEDLAWMLERVKKYIAQYGTGSPSAIEVLSVRPQNMTEIEAFERIKKECRLEPWIDKVELVFCEWASLHTDPDWLGKAFVSLVVGTGPSPYTVSTHKISRKKDSQIPSVKTRGFKMHTGDLFVLDPTLPHSANPCTNHYGSLLVLMQVTELFGSEQEKIELFDRYPPAKDGYPDAFCS